MFLLIIASLTALALGLLAGWIAGGAHVRTSADAVLRLMASHLDQAATTGAIAAIVAEARRQRAHADDPPIRGTEDGTGEPVPDHVDGHSVGSKPGRRMQGDQADAIGGAR